MDKELYDLIKNERKILAIKYLREKYNFELKDAKYFVDNLDINDLDSFKEDNIKIYGTKNLENYGDKKYNIEKNREYEEEKRLNHSVFILGIIIIFLIFLFRGKILEILHSLF